MTELRSEDWRDGFATGKSAGRRFRGQFGPVTGRERNERDDLDRRLADVLVANARGFEVADEDVAALRRLAVRTRERDWSGTSIGTMAMLWKVFGDRPARAWLPSMLAGAGRYEDAVALPTRRAPGSPPGGPPAWADVLVVSALSQLGREDEACKLMHELMEQFPGIRDGYVTAWQDTAESRAYARLVEASPGRSSVLPVFFHLPFSGGTSMIASLKKVIPWARIVRIQRRFGLYQAERAMQLTADEVNDLQMVHLHHPFTLTLPGRELSYFTVLRDPVSQIASGYYKRRSAKGIVPTLDTSSSSFEEHIVYSITKGLTNTLARQIVTTHPALHDAYAKEFDSAGAFRAISAEEDMFWFEATSHLSDEELLTMCRETLDERFHLVGSMRHLEASHLAAAASLGVPVAERVGHHGTSGRPEYLAGGAAIARLQDANQVDQQLYEEYTARFERHHSELIEAVDGRQEEGATSS